MGQFTWYLRSNISHDRRRPLKQCVELSRLNSVLTAECEPTSLEPGAGTGACGVLIAAAAASRGLPVDALLTDRNLAALDLAASSAAEASGKAAATSKAKGTVAEAEAAKAAESAAKAASSAAAKAACATIRTARYAFGEDVSASILAGSDNRPDIIVVSDVLYAPESAAPLVSTLRQLFGRGGGGVSNGGGGGGGGAGPVVPPSTSTSTSTSTCCIPATTPACYLAWRPRVGNPDKISAMKAFLAECAAEGLTVREASRRLAAPVSKARVWGDNDEDDGNGGDSRGGGGGGDGGGRWCQDFNPEESAAKGLCILRIEPP